MNSRVSIVQDKEQINDGADTVSTVDALNDESFRLRHLDLIKAADLAQKALQLSQKHNYQPGVGHSLLNLGFQQLTRSSYREAFESFNRALNIFKELKDPGGIAHANYNLGLVYLRMGDFETAMEVQQESLKLRITINDEEGIASCKSQIGYLNSQFGLEETALNDYGECLAIFKKKDNKAGMANVLMALGILKMKLNRLDEARNHLIESRDLRIQINEVNGIHGSVNYLSSVYMKEGNPQEALKILKEALDEAQSQKQPFTIGICRLRLSLAKVYIMLGDQQNALAELENALNTAIQSGQKYQLHDIYFELSTVYKSLGIFDKALSYYEKYHLSKEEIINLNAATRLKNLEMVNKIESREKEIEIHRLRNVELRDKNREIREERKKSDALLLNILPSQTARELKKTGSTKPRQYPMVTVLFSDFVSFTHTSELLSPDQLVKKLDSYFRAFDEITAKHHVEKIKTIGDAYMAAGGIPVADTENPINTVKAGLEILDYVRTENDPLFRIRIGIHTGPVVAGIVGTRKFAYDIWGDTVNVASRMESSGSPGQINISGTTYEFVKDNFHCEHRGKVEAKKKGMLDMYFVTGTK